MTSTPAETAAKLDEAFPAGMVRQNPRGMDYVPVAEVIVRLNNVLGFDGWSHQIIERWSAGEIETSSGTYPKWCMATVRLTVNIPGVGPFHEGIGGQEVQFLNTGGGPVDMGDSWKGATSDALKKAAQALGVAIELARKEEALRAEAAAAHADETAQQLRDGGWESFAQYNERLGGLKTRARQLDTDAKATLASWWAKQEFKGALSVAQTDLYEEAIAGLEPAPKGARENAQPSNNTEAHPVKPDTAPVSGPPDVLDQLAGTFK